MTVLHKISRQRAGDPVKRLVKLSVSLGLYCADRGRELIARLRGRHLPGSCVVLYYHAVPCQQRGRFARQMDKLLRWARPAAAGGELHLAADTRHAAVTFDDGYQSVMENAVPELKRRGIPATLFVVPRTLRQRPSWGEFSKSGDQDSIMSGEQLRQLPSDLIEVGSHTMTHPDLTCLDDEEAKRELCESRAALNQILGREVRLLSFPFGLFDERLVRFCREAGYQRVFTTIPALGNPAEYVVGRVRVDPTDWPLEFRLKLFGAYRWLPRALSLKRKLLRMFLVAPVEKPSTQASS